MALTRPAPLRPHARKLIGVGLAVMAMAALDPLEGSVVVVVGGILVAMGARLRASRYRQHLYWCVAMMALGVGALWGLSAIGGFGGTSGRSYFWGLLILPYPIGWLAGLIGGIRAFGEPRPV
jgi:uncharacterized membrane protein